jgi:hypothetical protein
MHRSRSLAAGIGAQQCRNVDLFEILCRAIRLKGGGQCPTDAAEVVCYLGRMNLIVLMVVLLLLFGGGGFYFGGPAIGGGGLGLVLIICLIIFFMGGFRAKN